MKTGIVIAIARELKAFLESKYEIEEIPDGARATYRVRRGEDEAYAVCSGCGLIDAAAATQYLITRFGVDRIFNYGVTGALDRSLKVDDLFLAVRTVNHDYDVSEAGGLLPHQYEEFPDAFIPLDGNLIKKAKEICPELKEASVASGNRFVHLPEDKISLATLGCEVCDMELAAIARTAFLAGVPVLSVKCISDTFDGDGKEFEKNVTRSAAKAFSVMEKLLFSV